MGSSGVFFADEHEMPRAKKIDNGTDYHYHGKIKTLLERRRGGKTLAPISSSSKPPAQRGAMASPSIAEKMTRLRLQHRPYGRENTENAESRNLYMAPSPSPLPSPTSVSKTLPPAQQKLLLKYGKVSNTTSGEEEPGNLGSMSITWSVSVTPKTCNLEGKLIEKNAQNVLVDSKQRLQMKALELRALKKENVVNDRRRVAGSLKKSSAPNEVQRKALELRSLKKGVATKNKSIAEHRYHKSRQKVYEERRSMIRMSLESGSTLKTPAKCDKPYNKIVLSNIRKARSETFSRSRPNLSHANSDGGRNDSMTEWSNGVNVIQSCSFEDDEDKQSTLRRQRKRARAVRVKQFARKYKAGVAA